MSECLLLPTGFSSPCRREASHKWHIGKVQEFPSPPDDWCHPSGGMSRPSPRALRLPGHTYTKCHGPAEVCAQLQVLIEEPGTGHIRSELCAETQTTFNRELPDSLLKGFQLLRVLISGTGKGKGMPNRPHQKVGESSFWVTVGTKELNSKGCSALPLSS